MMYVAIIPVAIDPRYLVQVLHASGKVETTGGFTELCGASHFVAHEYPAAIELTPGEFFGMTIRRELAVAHV